MGWPGIKILSVFAKSVPFTRWFGCGVLAGKQEFFSSCPARRRYLSNSSTHEDVAGCPVLCDLSLSLSMTPYFIQSCSFSKVTARSWPQKALVFGLFFGWWRPAWHWGTLWARIIYYTTTTIPAVSLCFFHPIHYFFGILMNGSCSPVALLDLVNLSSCRKVWLLLHINFCPNPIISFVKIDVRSEQMSVFLKRWKGTRIILSTLIQ